MRMSWKQWIAVAAGAALVAALACSQTDVLQRKRVQVEGYVTGPALDKSGGIGPLESVGVGFPRNPGDNTPDELLTKTDRDGHYALSVDVNKGWCDPAYYFLFGYYEQNRLVCDSPKHTRKNVVLRSAHDASVPHDCHSICARFQECEEFFKITYKDLPQCEAHCAQGCSSSYLSCAYQYDDTGLSKVDKCVDLYDCYQKSCDPGWFQSDDDSGDDTGA